MISGSKCAATAKPRRTYIPLEYRFTGVSMNCSTPENSTIVVEVVLDLPPLHPEDRAVQVHVLATRELLVEAGSDLEQAADATADLGPPAASERRSG